MASPTLPEERISVCEGDSRRFIWLDMDAGG
jgi:hypothetical protein